MPQICAYFFLSISRALCYRMIDWKKGIELALNYWMKSLEFLELLAQEPCKPPPPPKYAMHRTVEGQLPPFSLKQILSSVLFGSDHVGQYVRPSIVPTKHSSCTHLWFHIVRWPGLSSGSAGVWYLVLCTLLVICRWCFWWSDYCNDACFNGQFPRHAR